MQIAAVARVPGVRRNVMEALATAGAFLLERRVRKQLDFRTLAGVPTVEPSVVIDDASVEIQEVPVSPVVIEGGERVEIYDFEATYQGENFDVNAFYHTPRFHWGYEGDFFGLVWEATDTLGMDIWNAKAPEGIEIVGKNKWKGLTLLAGPEVYWGANPKFVLKYDFSIGNTNWTFIHSEDVARLGQGAAATQATERQSRQTTLYMEKEFSNSWKLELGGIMAATEKVDEVYTRVDDAQNVYLDKIDFQDTLGLKAKLTFPLFGYETYVTAHHAGLVADGGQHHKVFGVTDPSRLPYSGMGNKQEVEAGMILRFGDFMLYPRAMYRDNLVDANPFIEPASGAGILVPGISPRNTDDDPFAVLGNREARSAEMYLTYDPTGATQFYDWDNDWREDAKFAFNIGGTYTEYPTPTDSYLFFLDIAGRNVPFGAGLPPEDVWGVSSRIVMNPNRNQKYIFRLVRGFEQTAGTPQGDPADYFQFHWKAEFKRKHVFEGYFLKDAWGTYDFFRQFNLQYPEQYKLDYSVKLGAFGQIGSVDDENRATRVGIRALYRAIDESNEEFEITGDYEYLVAAYFTYQF